METDTAASRQDLKSKWADIDIWTGLESLIQRQPEETLEFPEVGLRIGTEGGLLEESQRRGDVVCSEADLLVRSRMRGTHLANDSF